jgi:hypothetical protein
MFMSKSGILACFLAFSIFTASAVRAEDFACAASKSLQPDLKALEDYIQQRGAVIRKNARALKNLLAPTSKEFDDLDRDSKILSAAQWSAVALSLGILAGGVGMGATVEITVRQSINATLGAVSLGVQAGARSNPSEIDSVTEQIDRTQGQVEHAMARDKILNARYAAMAVTDSYNHVYMDITRQGSDELNAYEQAQKKKEWVSFPGPTFNHSLIPSWDQWTINKDFWKIWKMMNPYEISKTELQYSVAPIKAMASAMSEEARFYANLQGQVEEACAPGLRSLASAGVRADPRMIPDSYRKFVDEKYLAPSKDANAPANSSASKPQ